MHVRAASLSHRGTLLPHPDRPDRAEGPQTAAPGVAHWHLDLYTDDQAAEVGRLTGLGARFVRPHHDPDDDYVVMADPGGNEFCVCAVPDA